LLNILKLTNQCAISKIFRFPLHYHIRLCSTRTL